MKDKWGLRRGSIVVLANSIQPKPLNTEQPATVSGRGLPLGGFPFRDLGEEISSGFDGGILDAGSGA